MDYESIDIIYPQTLQCDSIIQHAAKLIMGLNPSAILKSCATFLLLYYKITIC